MGWLRQKPKKTLKPCPVSVDHYITFLPDYAVRAELESGCMAVMDVHLGDVYPSSTIICVQKGHGMTRAAQVFLSHLQNKDID